jgi:superfamily II DNA helicase RecQ
MYNLMNIVQAIGRLRPHQRHPGGTITIVAPTVNPYNAFDKKKQKLIDDSYENMASKLEMKRVLCNNREAFLSVCSQKSVRSCLTDSRCTLVAIAERFRVKQSRCGVCDNCLKSPIAKSTRTATAQLAVAVQNRNSASPLLGQLADKCCFCRSAECDGQSRSCFGSGRCFKCGGRGHRVKNCPVSYENIIKGRGCYCCLDVNSRQGYIRHTAHYKECPLKKRLIRLLMEYHSRQSHNNSDQQGFEEFCSSIYLNQHTFATFIQDNRSILLK